MCGAILRLVGCIWVSFKQKVTAKALLNDGTGRGFILSDVNGGKGFPVRRNRERDELHGVNGAQKFLNGEECRLGPDPGGP